MTKRSGSIATPFFRTLCGQSGEDLALFPEMGNAAPTNRRCPISISSPAACRRSIASAPQTHGALYLRAGADATVLPALVFTEAILQFQPNSDLEREVLVSSLLRLGYRKGIGGGDPGRIQYSWRIVDIYSTAYPDPLRVEFWATRSNRSVFDPATQNRPIRSSRPGCCPRGTDSLRRFTRRALAPLAADAEWHAPSVYGAMDSLLDYFPQPPVLVLDQPGAPKAHTAECWQAIEEGYLRHEDRTDPNPLSDSGPAVSHLGSTRHRHSRLCDPCPGAGHPRRMRAGNRC